MSGLLVGSIEQHAASAGAVAVLIAWVWWRSWAARRALVAVLVRSRTRWTCGEHRRRVDARVACSLTPDPRVPVPPSFGPHPMAWYSRRRWPRAAGGDHRQLHDERASRTGCEGFQLLGLRGSLRGVCLRLSVFARRRALAPGPRLRRWPGGPWGSPTDGSSRFYPPTSGAPRLLADGGPRAAGATWRCRTCFDARLLPLAPSHGTIACTAAASFSGLHSARLRLAFPVRPRCGASATFGSTAAALGGHADPSRRLPAPHAACPWQGQLAGAGRVSTSSARCHERLWNWGGVTRP